MATVKKSIVAVSIFQAVENHNNLIKELGLTFDDLSSLIGAGIGQYIGLIAEGVIKSQPEKDNPMDRNYIFNEIHRSIEQGCYLYIKDVLTNQGN